VPAVAPYIPNRDSMLSNWLANFSSLISAAPALYGLLSSDGTTIAAAVAGFQAAYALVTSPTTKTAQTVSAKNTQRVLVLAIVRPYAQTIGLNPGVTSDNKIALGLNPKTSTPSPISAPTTNPVLTIQSLGNKNAILRYRDSAASVSVKGKPYGVKQIRVYGMVSATPVADPTLLPLLGTFTKSPFTVSFPQAAVGSQVYIAAQWATQTGGLSPWSGIINLTVAGTA
jgi:hypothetical protein